MCLCLASRSQLFGSFLWRLGRFVALHGGDGALVLWRREWAAMWRAIGDADMPMRRAQWDYHYDLSVPDLIVTVDLC
jgi:hypothetical protein